MEPRYFAARHKPYIIDRCEQNVFDMRKRQDVMLIAIRLNKIYGNNRFDVREVNGNLIVEDYILKVDLLVRAQNDLRRIVLRLNAGQG